MDTETKASLPDMARDYVELLNTPTNGWGQHVHPIYGQSHFMLLKMKQEFGEVETNKAIDRAFHNRRQK